MVPRPSDQTEEGARDVLGLFSCSICTDLLVDPLTLSCCGRSFCRPCLERLKRTQLLRSGITRCPGGCEEALPWQLPAVTRALAEYIEAHFSEELARRREEVEEEEDAPEDEQNEEAAQEHNEGAPEGEEEEASPAAGRGKRELPGGFTPWEEVVALRDLVVGRGAEARPIVEAGTPGLAVCAHVCRAGDRPSQRVTVKFERRLDCSPLCVNVMPDEIGKQLPRSFKVRVRQQVAAAHDLYIGTSVVVHFGVRGIVESRASDPNRLVVRFESRADGVQGSLSVQPFEVVPCGPYVGGFNITQRVVAAHDLYAGQTLMVRAGTMGTVLGPYNEARLVVQFDARIDRSPDQALNVLASEIQAFAE